MEDKEKEQNPVYLKNKLWTTVLVTKASKTLRGGLSLILRKWLLYTIDRSGVDLHCLMDGLDFFMQSKQGKAI